MSDPHNHGRQPLPPSWFEKNPHLIVRGVVVLAVAVVIFDIVYGLVAHKHAHFPVETFPGFYASMGFASYLFLVLTAKQLRKILARPANYYDSQPPLLAWQPGDEKLDASHDDHHDHGDHHDGAHS